MNRISLGSDIIASAGYDALYQVMEIKFSSDGHVCRYYDVPEHIWYGMRTSYSIGVYFHSRVVGRYTEEMISDSAKDYS